MYDGAKEFFWFFVIESVHSFHSNSDVAFGCFPHLIRHFFWVRFDRFDRCFFQPNGKFSGPKRSFYIEEICEVLARVSIST